MKFVLVKAPESATARQQELLWTYLCEAPVKVGRRTRQVRAGDYVVGEFGYEPELMEVVEAASRRSGLKGTDYRGAVKVCVPAPKALVDASKEADKLWAAVNRAEERASSASQRFGEMLQEALA